MSIFWLLGCLWVNIYYAVQFIKAYWFWNKIPTNAEANEPTELHSFSIVVPARNEANNVLSLLSSLTAIDYPKDKFEILLVDDFSEDDTVKVAKEYAAQFPEHNINIISLDGLGLKHNNAFKKTAIQIGVSKAKHSWIVSTDADCHHTSQYLHTLNKHIATHQPKFVSGPVSLEPSVTPFQRMQSLEFKGLVGLGASYIQQDQPFLCNGANLAFPKDVFERLNGFKGVDDHESGDDIWFMHKVQKRHPFELTFMKEVAAIVRTEPLPTLRDFMNQRKRWTAKNSSYTNWRQLLTLSMDYLFYCALLANLVMCCVGVADPWLLAFMLGSKALVELVFYSALNKFYSQKGWVLTYLYTFPVQIFYVVLIYPLSQLTRFEWKNRRFNA